MQITEKSTTTIINNINRGRRRREGSPAFVGVTGIFAELSENHVQNIKIPFTNGQKFSIMVSR